MFVLHREGGLPFSELHGIGHADKAKAVRAQRQPTHRPNAATHLLAHFVDAFVEGAPLGRQAIVIPQLREMD